MKNKYYIYGLKPIFMEENDEIRTYFAFQWKTGEFVEDMRYYLKITHDLSGDAEEITKEEFDDYVAELRNKIEK